MELVAKESSDAGHPMSDKMQVTTIVFSSLPLSWEKVVSTFSLLNLKSPLLSTKYPSSYASTNLSPSLGHQAYLTIPQIHYFIWPTILQYLKSTISCGLLSYNTSNPLFHMAYYLVGLHPTPSKHTMTPTGLAAPMIGNPSVAFVAFLALILFFGPFTNKEQSPVLAPNLNIAL
jgi:hypothetical protein